MAHAYSNPIEVNPDRKKPQLEIVRYTKYLCELPPPRNTDVAKNAMDNMDPIVKKAVISLCIGLFLCCSSLLYIHVPYSSFW
mmetsp:Transcript_40358/g.58996  ORF Transcript_40358/g.58996 Transcript_40358/m.58996 type:complete len:82 (+) Transcript_40358:236-481(+)